MYYCNGCGLVRFLSRPENTEPPMNPLINLFCNFCQAETIYRKVLPEDFHAAHEVGVETMMKDMMKALYKKLTTPMSEGEEIKLDFLEEDEEE